MREVEVGISPDVIHDGAIDPFSLGDEIACGLVLEIVEIDAVSHSMPLELTLIPDLRTDFSYGGNYRFVARIRHLSQDDPSEVALELPGVIAGSRLPKLDCGTVVAGVGHLECNPWEWLDQAFPEAILRGTVLSITAVSAMCGSDDSTSRTPGLDPRRFWTRATHPLWDTAILNQVTRVGDICDFPTAWDGKSPPSEPTWISEQQRYQSYILKVDVIQGNSS